MDIRFRSAQGLTILASDDGDSEVFSTFYEGFDRAFTLPDEKESREGFTRCLALNQGPGFRRLCARFGPFRELVVVVELDGVQAGGANIFVTPLREHSVVTLNLNYVYVSPAFRGRGLLRRLIEACRELTEWLFPGAGPLLIFLEMNDPLLLTTGQYERDTKVSGIDQFDRIVIWAKLGVRVVDFPYVQPPLSADQRADENLLYGVLSETVERVPGGLLADHLERFFAVSVLKTGNIASNELAARQVRECRGVTSIATLDPTPALSDLRRKVGAASKGIRRHLADLLA